MKRILYPLILIFFTLIFYRFLNSQLRRLGISDEHYDKIYKAEIYGRVTDLGEGRYTSIQIDNADWYDAGFKIIKPDIGDSLPEKLFKLNDSVFKKANNDTVVMIRSSRKYFYILP